MAVLAMSSLFSLQSVTSSYDGDMDNGPLMPRVAMNMPKYNSWSSLLQATVNSQSSLSVGTYYL